MKIDAPITNSGNGSSMNPEFVRELIRWEDEDKACPVSPAELVLEQKRIALVLSMTAARFAQLSPAEKRNYRRWAENFERVFTEKANLIRRNSPPEPQLPAVWRAQG